MGRYDIATDLFHKKDFDGAIQQFRKEIVNKKKHNKGEGIPISHGMIALCYEQLQDQKSSVREYELAIASGIATYGEEDRRMARIYFGFSRMQEKQGLWA
ncbi:predicted protein [Chaetoceros tenuissimus]|uniref:Uncharacterized protein n=1 Tax=Chaetoceros tenuissimus TaxID=426638 RepID=A0AAD3D2B4_9STRA|nr:predicted protein [Chaetoceros tenuissimus]